MPLTENDRLMLKRKGFTSNPVQVAAVRGLDKVQNLSKPDEYQNRDVPKAVGSRANPVYSFNVYDGILTDDSFKNKRDKLEPTLNNLLNDESGYPGLLYDPIDFMHCKDIDHASGYHMITLRRFPYPVRDFLYYKDHPLVDMSRLVGFSTDETNKLSDIMSMSFGLKWKELTADFWTPDVIGDQHGADGILGTMFRLMNPNYIAESGAGKYGMNVNPMYDQNKVYGPVDSLTSTHIRDRGVNFNHEITLNFDYELRAYDGVNPKAALLDLLANVLVMGTNDAMFWGGAINWYGIPKSYYQNYISVNEAKSMNKNFVESAEYYAQQFSTLFSGNSEGDKGSLFNMIRNLGSMIMNNIGAMAVQRIVSTIGRPSVAVMNSLLSDEPVGLWHLTVGNPYRPILSIGNLILTNTKLTFSDSIGHDGFPTGFRVTCTLKHAMPRGRAEIESMFNYGAQRLYWKPTDSELQKNMKESHVYSSKTSNFLNNVTNEIYQFIDKIGNTVIERGFTSGSNDGNKTMELR